MTTPTTTQPQAPLTMLQLGIIEQNVREQITLVLSSPAVRANLNAGYYVAPYHEVAARECIERTVAAVVIEIITK